MVLIAMVIIIITLYRTNHFVIGLLSSDFLSLEPRPSLS